MNKRLRIAEQTMALFARHNHNNGHTIDDDRELLDQLTVFVNECLNDDAPDIHTRAVLNQYTIPHACQLNIPLDDAHIELIHTYLDDWVCEYHEQSRTD